MFERCKRGLSNEEIMRLSNKSAIDFWEVKTSTANAGDIGNIVRVLSSSMVKKNRWKVANHLYHTLAQSSLDSKHGTTNVVGRISSLLRSGVYIDPETFNKMIAGFLTQKEINLLVAVSYTHLRAHET